MPELAIRKPASIFDAMKDMHEQITHRAYEIFRDDGGSFGRDWDHWFRAEQELFTKPPMELREADGRLVLEAAVSGVDPKDLDIEVTPEDIVLKGKIGHDGQDDKHKCTVHFCEFNSGMMFRSIHLPKRINPDRVKAEVKNGMLHLTAEVAAEAQVRRIKPEAA
jgi:HSP20 family protein